MGTQKDIIFTYDDLDQLWRLSLGEHADISAAYYNGDYSKSLEQAQRDKHEWILEGTGFKPGCRVLDIGCGWGPMLKTIKDCGGDGVGLSLSPKQVEVCQRNGLNAILRDWKDLQPGELGKFDVVISIGSFEHFCSVEEYFDGKRDEIYDSFFHTCCGLLVDNGRLYLQTMTWGKNLPWGDREPTVEDEKQCSLRAPYKTDERILASVRMFFPGSWIPRDHHHIERVAKPYFDLLVTSNGRLDYVKTLTEWEKAWYAPHRKKILPRIKIWLTPFFRGKACRAKMRCLKENDIREVFIRDLFGHQRIFFQKKPASSAHD
jgi:cyclopropane-fatty-acyl-phospholipid synthase